MMDFKGLVADGRNPLQTPSVEAVRAVPTESSQYRTKNKQMEITILPSFYILLACPFAVQADELKLQMLAGEYWWGGLSSVGHETPYDSSAKVSHDMWGNNKGNQAQPLLLSNKKRYVWSEEPIHYDFDKGRLTVSTRSGKILSGTQGTNLREAYRHVSREFFPSSGMIPEKLLFTHPQYNPWIELMYDQNERDRWWNGASACLDLSNPKAREWFQSRLDHLVDEYGVDGFKFDAGDADFYGKGVVSLNPLASPNDHSAYFAQIGLHYPLNEFRASWKMAGLPLAQRLRDKGHEWGDLAKLIPDLLSQSVMGYAYTCPDMIGGGEYRSFLSTDKIDEELVVRSAQVHALMPMMQFSVAPWRILSKENNTICLEMAKLHQEMGDKILSLAKEASKSGEPIVKPMAMTFPEGGYNPSRTSLSWVTP